MIDITDQDLEEMQDISFIEGWNEALDFAINEISNCVFLGYEDLQDEIITILKDRKNID